MTRDDIIRMAREAKQYAEYVTPQGLEWFDTYNERFAALVAAAEREACAQEIESWGPQRYVDDLVAAIRARGQLPAHQAFEHGARIVMEGKL